MEGKFKRGETVTVTWKGTAPEVSANYVVKGCSDTTLILEEGPGLSVIVRRNLAEKEPTWRFDGASVTIIPYGNSEE